MRLIQVGPSTWRFQRDETPPARSDLPCPMIISDQMDPTEQVDGSVHTSKSSFRRVQRELGLIEIGTEKQTPKKIKPDPKKRRESIKRAVEKYKNGERARAR